MTTFHIKFGEVPDFQHVGDTLRIPLGGNVFLSCDVSEIALVKRCAIYLEIDGEPKDAKPKSAPIERIYEVTPDGGLQERQDRSPSEPGEGGV